VLNTGYDDIGVCADWAKVWATFGAQVAPPAGTRVKPQPIAAGGAVA